MAKINRTIVAIKTALTSNGVDLQKGTRTTKRTTKYLLKLFSLIEDPRVPGMIDYPLDYIILIAFLSVLAGSNTWIDMQDFGNAKRSWLRKFLNVKKYGIPSHDIQLSQHRVLYSKFGYQAVSEYHCLIGSNVLSTRIIGSS